jgi:hypothetical protein
MKNKILTSISLIFALSLPANAINISTSEKTKKSSVIFNFNIDSPLILGLRLMGNANIAPFYSEIAGKLSENQQEFSLMATGGLNLGYDLKLLYLNTVLGQFDPTLTPYIGYQHYFANTSGLSINTSGISTGSINSNANGMNFGLRLTSNLPLGLFAYAEGGFTRLIGGSWSEFGSNNSNNINVNDSSLPYWGIGATWNIFNILNLRAGYKMFILPDIRKPSTPLDSNSNIPIYNIDLGLSFLFFSI